MSTHPGCHHYLDGFTPFSSLVLGCEVAQATNRAWRLLSHEVLRKLARPCPSGQPNGTSSAIRCGERLSLTIATRPLGGQAA
jgi:hypothetical protein